MVRVNLATLFLSVAAFLQTGVQAQPPAAKKAGTPELKAEEAKKILSDEKLRKMLHPFVGEKGSKSAYTFRYDNLKEALSSEAAFKRLLEPAVAEWMREEKMPGRAAAQIRAWEQTAKEKDTSLFKVFSANALYQLEDGETVKDRFLDAKEALDILRTEIGKERNKRNYVIRRMEEKGSGNPPDATVLKK